MRFEPIPAFRFLTEKPLGSYRYRAAYGGRGTAKSWEVVNAAIFHALITPKLRVVFLREIMANLKESSLELVRSRLDHYGLLGTYFREVDGAFEGKHGQKIMFIGLWKGGKPEGIKSLEGAGLTILEEAQEARQRSLDVLMPTVLRTAISEIWAVWNPDQKTDPVDVFFRGPVRPNRAICRKITYRQNPFFPEALQELMELDRQKDPDRAAWIWDGEYRKGSEARVFRNWKVEEFETPPDAVLRFGADWGFSVDPTVLVRAFIIGRKLYIDHEAVEVGCEIDATPALFDKIPGSRKWTIRADSSRPETVSYMQRKQFKIIPAIKGPGSVEDGIEFLKTFDIIVHPRCTHTIEELTLYSFKVDPLTSEILPILEDKNNHVIDALRYACEAVRKAVKPTPATPSRNPPDLWGRSQESSVSWKTV